MCAVSMVLNQGLQQWPNIYQQPNEVEIWKQWFELYRQAQEFDKKTKQADCEDPAKMPILEKILERLEILEKKIDARSN